MYIADGGGGITSEDIDIEQQRIDLVLESLTQARSSVLRGSRLARVPAASLGGAPTAVELELHAGKAHHHVVESMDRTTDGLDSYRRALDGFLADIEERQAEQVQRFTAIQDGLTCVATPTFEENAACVAAGEEG
jgi:hypothetical protein